jgi:hypothetical protein
LSYRKGQLSSLLKEIMNTKLNTQAAEQAIIKFKRFVNAYETAKELFPELKHQQWITLADCLVQAVFEKKH